MSLSPYITLEDAQEYLSMFFVGEATEITEADLRKASLTIERIYGARLKPWADDDIVPLPLQHAVVELAVLMAGGSFDPYKPMDASVKKRKLKVEGIETDIEYHEGSAPVSPLTRIELILGPLFKQVQSSGLSWMPVRVTP